MAASLGKLISDHASLKVWFGKKEQAEKQLRSELKQVHAVVEAALVSDLDATCKACKELCGSMSTWRSAIKGDGLDNVVAAAKKAELTTPAFALKLKTVLAKLTKDCKHACCLTSVLSPPESNSGGPSLVGKVVSSYLGFVRDILVVWVV